MKEMSVGKSFKFIGLFLFVPTLSFGIVFISSKELLFISLFDSESSISLLYYVELRNIFVRGRIILEVRVFIFGLRFLLSSKTEVIIRLIKLRVSRLFAFEYLSLVRRRSELVACYWCIDLNAGFSSRSLIPIYLQNLNEMSVFC